MISQFVSVFFTILLSCLTTIHATPQEDCSSDVRSMRVGLRHIENKGIGYNTGYTTLETFLAFPPELWRVMPFVDLRAHTFNNGHWAANGGIGVRGDAWNRVYGINLYYDY